MWSQLMSRPTVVEIWLLWDRSSCSCGMTLSRGTLINMWIALCPNQIPSTQLLFYLPSNKTTIATPLDFAVSNYEDFPWLKSGIWFYHRDSTLWSITNWRTAPKHGVGSTRPTPHQIPWCLSRARMIFIWPFKQPRRPSKIGPKLLLRNGGRPCVPGQMRSRPIPMGSPRLWPWSKESHSLNHQ